MPKQMGYLLSFIEYGKGLIVLIYRAKRATLLDQSRRYEAGSNGGGSMRYYFWIR